MTRITSIPSLSSFRPPLPPLQEEPGRTVGSGRSRNIFAFGETTPSDFERPSRCGVPEEKRWNVTNTEDQKVADRREHLREVTREAILVLKAQGKKPTRQAIRAAVKVNSNELTPIIREVMEELDAEQAAMERAPVMPTEVENLSRRLWSAAVSAADGRHADERDAWQAQVSQLKDKCSGLQSDLDDAETQVEAGAKDRQDLAAKVARLQAERDDFAARLAVADARLAERSVLVESMQLALAATARPRADGGAQEQEPTGTGRGGA